MYHTGKFYNNVQLITTYKTMGLLIKIIGNFEAKRCKKAFVLRNEILYFHLIYF